MSRQKELAALASSLVLALASHGAFAQSASTGSGQAWPAKPVRWIVTFPPGGSADTAVRPVADRLAQTLGQPFVVENRPGAAGTVGAEYVAKSPADGYTVLTIGDGIASTPHLYPKLGFDPLKDFVAVVQLTRQPILLAAHPSLGVGSVSELVALAKKKPGMAIGTSGAGTPQHVAAEWFVTLAGIQLTHVPYKGGAQVVTDFIGGQIPIVSLGPAPLVPHHRTGRIRILAQASAKRSPLLPDVPTYEESGIEGLVLEQWYGVFLRTGTADDVVERLGAHAARAVAEPGVRSRYAQSGLEAVGGTRAQFAAVVRADYEKYGRLIRTLNIKMD